MGEPLPLVEDVKNDSFVIKGITTESVGSIKEVFEKLKRGELNRHYAETYMNHSSSRSHCLFRLQIKALTNAFVKAYRQQNTSCANVNVLNHIDTSHEGTIVTESYLNFVDLAGNERMSAHLKGVGAVGAEDEDYNSYVAPTANKVNSRINEGKHINKSLFFLTHVISLKAEGKASQHIPFRNSPLTKILRSSLGGNFRTAVVLCLNPTNSQVEVSMSTLRFGQNAKKIQNKVQANIITNNNEETIKVLVESYERRIRELQMQHESDFSRYDQYINIIEELKLQRTSLLERLETANKKLALKIAEEIPQNELQRFFWSVNQQAAYFNTPGLLFTSQKLAKFEEFDPEDYEWETSPTHKMADRMKKKFKKEMDPVGKDTFLGKLALKMYQKIKKEFDELQHTVFRQKEYMTNFCKSYKSLCEFMHTVSGLGQVYLGKLNQIIEEYQSEYLLSNERKIKLELYENAKGMSLLTDKDIETMERYIVDYCEAIKCEKDRRQLLSKESDIPDGMREGLEELYKNELEDQEFNLTAVKQKIEDFHSFREGCELEIKYYGEMSLDFLTQHQVEVKLKEVDRIINEDIVKLTEKLERMKKNFLQADSELETKQKSELDSRLKEYKSKFEKLVDVVLGQSAVQLPSLVGPIKEVPSIAGIIERASVRAKSLKRCGSFSAIDETEKGSPGKPAGPITLAQA